MSQGMKGGSRATIIRCGAWAYTNFFFERLLCFNDKQEIEYGGSAFDINETLSFDL
jgi:hypothetical protein